MNEDLIDVDGAAKRLGTSVRHIRRLVHERRIPYHKVGGLVRFRPDDIQRWLATTRVEAIRASYSLERPPRSPNRVSPTVTS